MNASHALWMNGSYLYLPSNTITVPWPLTVLLCVTAYGGGEGVGWMAGWLYCHWCTSQAPFLCDVPSFDAITFTRATHALDDLMFQILYCVIIGKFTGLDTIMSCTHG